ncbi:hypothetical protein JOQ06_004860 [Pogonophryne albipinna]|uniref:Uncharacterized protein n=1 Tax=Pogonophryne albipinna TaxID=1090488 RepID=A0AAD6FBX2_9TELE|nr:hypothetical protein JOQ06_004860 [Pogonophryne albipinna]
MSDLSGELRNESPDSADVLQREVMTDLLEKIKGEHKDVAEVLQDAGIRNDSNTLSLTELLELFPGHKYLKLRRTILEMIQEMQTHVKHILSFYEAHIRFLEENLPNQPDPESAPNLKEPLGNIPPQETHGHSSDLLKEIGNRDSEAADVLREADLCIDSDIRSLTREDLLELFPGPKKFKLRRGIFEMIHKEMSFQTKMFLQRTKAVNKRKGKLVYQVVVTGTTFDAHFQLMEKVKKEVQDQFDLVQSNRNDYDVTIVFCPIVSCMGLDVESAMRDVKGDKPVILVLMHHAYEAKFIPNVQQGANVQLQVNVFFHETKRGLLHCGENGAVVCEITKYLQEIPIPNAQADLRNESDIRSLTGAESCHQLLPEQKDLSFEMIQKKKSLVQLLKQMKDISADFKDALTDNGVLVDNLSILKDMKTHMKDMQSFLDDHICSLEANIQNQPNQESAKPGISHECDEANDNCPEGAHGPLKYQMVVSGTTFGAHDQLMEKVKKEVQDQFDLVQSNSDDYGVTIVFCPIVSRMGPDVESALRDVKGDKPVILVLMHHAYEAKFIPKAEPGRGDANVQLQVNVFFHETKHGLLHCEENTAAVCNIKNKIQEYTISNALVVAAGNTGILAAILQMVVAVVYYLLDWFK